jgi:hypothetical protein
MLEPLLCSLLAILPDRMYRGFRQGKHSTARAMGLVAGTAAFACASALSATSARSQPAGEDRVSVEYVMPANPAFKPLYDFLRANRVLETARDRLAVVRWPRTLRLKFDGCNGEPNAFYEDAVITLCYEFLDQMWRSANSSKLPRAVGREDAFVGQMLGVMLHEAGHAIIDLLNVPVLGQEEAAADQLAAYSMLQFPIEKRRRLILGAAYAHAKELKVRTARDLYRPRLRVERTVSFADEHGTTAQRLFNLLCLAYGSNHELFADAVEKGFLPIERAEICDREYKQVDSAYRALISPHVDGSR